MQKKLIAGSCRYNNTSIANVLYDKFKSVAAYTQNSRVEKGIAMKNFSLMKAQK